MRNAHRSWLVLVLDAKAVVFDARLSGSLTANRMAGHCPVSLIRIAPVDLIAELHAGKFDSNFGRRSGEATRAIYRQLGYFFVQAFMQRSNSTLQVLAL